MNRLTPLRIWGPSGHAPEYGTAHAMDRMKEMYKWDLATREGLIDFRGGILEVHEGLTSRFRAQRRTTTRG